MKRIFLVLLFFIFSFASLYSQIQRFEYDALTDTIKHSPKKYKLIYIFCDYCRPSIERFPKLLEMLEHEDRVAIFPICAQDSIDVVAYMEQYRIQTPIYLINQNRKRRKISFYNPIKAVCKYLNEYLKIPIEKMGASDYCILDVNFGVLLHTNWKVQDAEYFSQLSQFLNSKE